MQEINVIVTKESEVLKFEVDSKELFASEALVEMLKADRIYISNLKLVLPNSDEYLFEYLMHHGVDLRKCIDVYNTTLYGSIALCTKNKAKYKTRKESTLDFETVKGWVDEDKDFFLPTNSILIESYIGFVKEYQPYYKKFIKEVDIEEVLALCRIEIGNLLVKISDLTGDSLLNISDLEINSLDNTCYFHSKLRSEISRRRYTSIRTRNTNLELYRLAKRVASVGEDYNNLRLYGFTSRINGGRCTSYNENNIRMVGVIDYLVSKSKKYVFEGDSSKWYTLRLFGLKSCDRYISECSLDDTLASNTLIKSKHYDGVSPMRHTFDLLDNKQLDDNVGILTIWNNLISSPRKLYNPNNLGVVEDKFDRYRDYRLKLANFISSLTCSYDIILSELNPDSICLRVKNTAKQINILRHIEMCYKCSGLTGYFDYISSGYSISAKMFNQNSDSINKLVFDIDKLKDIPFSELKDNKSSNQGRAMQKLLAKYCSFTD